jgi:hypothetical protein
MIMVINVYVFLLYNLLNIKQHCFYLFFILNIKKLKKLILIEADKIVKLRKCVYNILYIQ